MPYGASILYACEFARLQFTGQGQLLWVGVCLRNGELAWCPWSMKYIVETPKPVEQAVADLQAAVQRHKFGMLVLGSELMLALLRSQPFW